MYLVAIYRTVQYLSPPLQIVMHASMLGTLRSHGWRHYVEVCLNVPYFKSRCSTIRIASVIPVDAVLDVFVTSLALKTNGMIRWMVDVMG